MVKTACEASQGANGRIPVEKAEKLGSFLKTIVLEVVTKENKQEALSVLAEKDTQKLSVFICKYVKDFPDRFNRFVFNEILE